MNGLSIRIVLCAALAQATTVAPAIAQIGGSQQAQLCGSFRHNLDGSWAPLAPMSLRSPTGAMVRVSPGMSFREGTGFMGWDIGHDLNQQCQHR